jgi:hypothetical protein
MPGLGHDPLFFSASCCNKNTYNETLGFSDAHAVRCDVPAIPGCGAGHEEAAAVAAALTGPVAPRCRGATTPVHRPERPQVMRLPGAPERRSSGGERVPSANVCQKKRLKRGLVT